MRITPHFRAGAARVTPPPRGRFPPRDGSLLWKRMSFRPELGQRLPRVALSVAGGDAPRRPPPVGRRAACRGLKRQTRIFSQGSADQNLIAAQGGGWRNQGWPRPFSYRVAVSRCRPAPTPSMGEGGGGGK